jgi:hypothetical protein
VTLPALNHHDTTQHCAVSSHDPLFGADGRGSDPVIGAGQQHVLKTPPIFLAAISLFMQVYLLLIRPSRLRIRWRHHRSPAQHPP